MAFAAFQALAGRDAGGETPAPTAGRWVLHEAVRFWGGGFSPRAWGEPALLGRAFREAGARPPRPSPKGCALGNPFFIL